MTSEDHCSRIQQTFMEIFQYVSLLDETIDTESKEFDVVENQISRLFEESIEKSLTLGVDVRDYDQARFAVCAWVDEIVMNMNWVHSNKWRNTLRQMKHYGTTNAGIEFFRRLTSIEVKHSDVREIYLLCLGFGFTGQYSGSKNSYMLREILNTNHQLLQKGRGGSDKSINDKLFTLAYNGDNGKIKAGLVGSLTVQVKGQLKLAAWLVPPMVVSALYIWYSLLLDAQLSVLIVRIAG